MTDHEGRRLTPADFGIGVLFGAIREAVIVGDVTTGRVVLMNPSACITFGYSADEVAGLPLERLVPERLRAQHLAGVARYRRTGEGVIVGAGDPVELPGLHRDGHELDIDLTLSHLQADHLPGRYVLALVRDVSARKEAERAAARERLFLRSVLESVEEGIAVCDADGVLTLLNRAAREWHGVAEVTGRPEEWAQRYHLYDADGVRPLRPDEVPLYRAWQGEQVADTVVVIAGDGIPSRTVVCRGGPLSDADGRLLGALVAMHDVTAELAGEAERRRLAEAESQQEQALAINDSIVQGLVVAQNALLSDDPDRVRAALDTTMRSARGLVSQLLSHRGEVGAGDLVRTEAAVVLAEPDPPARLPEAAEPRQVRVLIADDTQSMRLLLRSILDLDGRFSVVAEAADGREAVDAVTRELPDVVVLDLAMPRLDGLQAIPLIRDASPGTKILILSGFEAAAMRDTALGRGAHMYVEKDASLTEIGDALWALVDGAGV